MSVRRFALSRFGTSPSPWEQPQIVHNLLRRHLVINRDHFGNLAQQPPLCVLYAPGNTGGTHTGLLGVKLGGGGEPFPFSAQRVEDGQESSAAHLTTQSSVANLSGCVETFSNIAQSSTVFLNDSKSMNSWDNGIAEEDNDSEGNI